MTFANKANGQDWYTDMPETKVTLKQLERIASALQDQYPLSDSWRRQTRLQYNRSRIALHNTTAAVWQTVANRTRDIRRWKRALRQAELARHYTARVQADIAYGLEFRAKHREDREAWELAGYRCFMVLDSYTYGTQPFPFAYASSHARRVQSDLAKLGVQSKTESPDYVYRSVRCSYWGGTYSDPSGHVVILVPAASELELELIRRKYTDAMREYWTGLRAKYNWALPIPEERFQDW